MQAKANISIFCDNDLLLPAAKQCAHTLALELNTQIPAADYQLHFSSAGVALRPTSSKKHGSVFVDFCEGKLAHRRKFGGGKGQLIAKACGLKGKTLPHILDATAGLGQDAFVLATLGCTVTLLERSPIAYALLNDGLRRAKIFADENDAELAGIIARMSLKSDDSIQYLQHQTEPVADVIYVDPMFPGKQKSAAVNKNMQAFHGVIGKDADDKTLLAAARAKARFRVVVKRPRLAPTIDQHSPSYVVEGKSSRYDIYTLKAMPS